MKRDPIVIIISDYHKFQFTSPFQKKIIFEINLDGKGNFDGEFN